MPKLTAETINNGHIAEIRGWGDYFRTVCDRATFDPDNAPTDVLVLADIRWCRANLAVIWNEREAITAAKIDIDHICDGPITAFVLMSRALREVRAGRHRTDHMAEALAEALCEHGWLVDDDRD